MPICVHVYVHTEKGGGERKMLSREELWQRKFQNRFELPVWVLPQGNQGASGLDQRYPGTGHITVASSIS